MKIGNSFINSMRISRIIAVLMCVSVALLAGSNTALGTPGKQALVQIPDALIDPGAGRDRFILVIEKKTQTLHIYKYENGNYYLLKTYSCTTGENVGDKKVEGDKKTPEGYYVFNKKAVEAELAPIYGVLAYPMDYPNFWDKRLGKNGMGIWLHGLNRPRVPRDSNGCIALENIDLIELEPYIKLYDTPIIVYDKISFADRAKLGETAARVRSFLEAWRKAWETKDFGRYKSCYAQDFSSDDGKNYSSWMDHKARLNSVYSKIRVAISDLRIFRHQGTLVADFAQRYQGDDNFTSDGRKRLYIKEKGNGYEIAAEAWQPTPPRSPQKFLSAEVKQRVRGGAGQTTTMVASAVKTDQAVKATKTPVVQQTKTDAVATTFSESDKDKVRQVLGDWLNAWRGQDIEKYLSHYHPDFRFKGMDLQDFKQYKAKLKEKYAKVNIDIKDVNILVEGGQALVTFVQDFRSDQYRDHGLKTLILQKNDQDWRIREESWKDMSAGAKP